MSIKGTQQTEKDLPHFDMVIVGGGMVGISLALILAAQGGWKILLVEAQSMNLASAPKPQIIALALMIALRPCLGRVVTFINP